MTTAHVYWLLGADDRLLYVGLTTAIRQRMEQHRRTQPWWAEVESIAHTDELSLVDAVALEVEDIRSLAPAYNRHAYPAHYPAAEVVVQRDDDERRAEWIAAQLAKAPQPKQAGGVVTVTETFTCEVCGPVQVALELREGTTVNEVAARLKEINATSRDVHDVETHFDGLVAS